MEEVYQDRILNLSVNCAKEAAKRKVGVYIMLSTAEVYDSDQVSPSFPKSWQCLKSQWVDPLLGSIEGIVENQAMDHHCEIQIPSRGTTKEDGWVNKE